MRRTTLLFMAVAGIGIPVASILVCVLLLCLFGCGATMNERLGPQEEIIAIETTYLSLDTVATAEEIGWSTFCSMCERGNLSADVCEKGWMVDRSLNLAYHAFTDGYLAWYDTRNASDRVKMNVLSNRMLIHAAKFALEVTSWIVGTGHAEGPIADLPRSVTRDMIVDLHNRMPMREPCR